METCSSSSILFLTSLILFLLQPSHSKTLVVDGFANWTKINPPVHVGDSLIFKYRQPLHNLYIFRNDRAFTLCNFSQATLLDKGNSESFKWNPSRPGFYYFSFSNSSVEPCKQGEKAAIRVLKKYSDESASVPSLPPFVSPSPSPTAGGHVPSSPANHWPFRSLPASSPSPLPGIGPTAPTSAPIMPDSGGGIPFINSNPAVPLPNGETDAATIRPLPTSGDGDQLLVGLLTFNMLCLISLLCLV